jgi:hypothetical protein
MLLFFLDQIYWLSLLTTFSKPGFILPSISLVRNCCKHHFFVSLVNISFKPVLRIRDPVFFWAPGSGMENNPDPGYEIRDRHLG